MRQLAGMSMLPANCYERIQVCTNVPRQHQQDEHKGDRNSPPPLSTHARKPMHHGLNPRSREEWGWKGGVRRGVGW